MKDAHGQWVGAAPLKISKSKNGLSHRLLRQVQFIGTQPTVFDWMKFAISPAASLERVIEAIAAVLRQSKWDVLDLQFHPDESQLRQLERCLQPNGKASGIQETTPIPYLKLPATETEYEKVRRKKTRLEVNRHCNRFSKEFGSPLQLEFQPATEASDAILTRFFAGHIKYWAEKKHKSDFQRFPKLFHFYKDMQHQHFMRAIPQQMIPNHLKRPPEKNELRSILTKTSPTSVRAAVRQKMPARLLMQTGLAQI